MTRRRFDPAKHVRNRYGRLVSAKASEARAKAVKKNTAFQRWRVALAEASKELGIKISPAHLHKGSPLHARAREIYDLSRAMDEKVGIKV